MPTLAIVQDTPAYLDREATLESAAGLCRDAAARGAEVVAFPEAFVAGYPTWIWRLRPGADGALAEELHAAMVASAVDLERDQLAPLRAAARELGIAVVVGVNEREGRFGRTTLYNTVVVIGPDGAVLNRHRKLMPTNPERMVWGLGDGSGLRVVDTPCGRLGVLICWENYMPLARHALYAQGVELYVAPTWDSGEGWIGTLRHIAREGRCWVAGCGTSLTASQLPEDLPGRELLFPDATETINPGDSVVVEPGGRIAAGPLHADAGILLAEVDPERVARSRRSLDVAGHYARPDVLRLAVDRSPVEPLAFREEDAPPA